MQRHAHVQNYLTEQDWNTLKSEEFDVGTKLTVLAKRTVAFGLLHPNESTIVHMVAVALASVQSCSFSANQALFIIRDFKYLHRKERQRSGTHAEDRLPELFPANPQDSGGSWGVREVEVQGPWDVGKTLAEMAHGMSGCPAGSARLLLNAHENLHRTFWLSALTCTRPPSLSTHRAPAKWTTPSWAACPATSRPAARAASST